MNLITQVKPISLSRWLCEVFIIAGSRIAYAYTPKETELTRPAAERFTESMALLCRNMPSGEYNIHTLYDERLVYPLFAAKTAKWVATEKIGEANLPRQEGKE